MELDNYAISAQPPFPPAARLDVLMALVVLQRLRLQTYRNLIGRLRACCPSIGGVLSPNVFLSPRCNARLFNLL